MKQKTPLAAMLHHRITFESLTETSDTGGGFTTSWSSFATVWAEISSLQSGSEHVQAMQLTGRGDFIITLRYLEGVTAKMRVKFGTRLFNIRRILVPGERNMVMKLVVEEGVAQ
jgi:SPP1 family predicted phage head-tail adaptor